MVQIFEGEYDEEGVYFYQAYCEEIASYAVKNQTFGGDKFNAKRMTWIKPSFAWVLYRSSYAQKHNQNRILKIKLSHSSLSNLLEKCVCKHSGGGSYGRVQWDPARDLLSSDKHNEPTKLLNKRAIQIGLKGPLSELYVKSIISIKDVTDLAYTVGIIHGVLARDNDGNIIKNKKKKKTITNEEKGILIRLVSNEKSYVPKCSAYTLEQLGMMPGKTADDIGKIGKCKK